MNEKRFVEGGCLCGQFRFRCEINEQLHSAHCSCRSCQHCNGVGISTCSAIPSGQFEILQGKSTQYVTRADSGREVRRNFCPQCGSPLYGSGSPDSGHVFIWASCFDQDDWINPQIHCWTASHPAWADLNADMRIFAQQNPPPK